MLAEPRVVMERQLEVEAGTTVAAAMPGDDCVLAGVIYESDPAQEPDMDKWVTELAFRLAG